jgi:hypothetical protein
MIRGRGRQGFLRAASTARLLAAAMAKNCRCQRSVPFEISGDHPMTPEEASEQQVEMWRQLSLEERFRIVAAMIEDGFALVAASIRAAHPEYTPEEFRAALRKRIYDD